MKRILLSLLAVATLVACSKSDDNNGDNNSGDGGGNNASNNPTSTEKLVKKITNKDEDGNLEEVITLTYEGGRPVSYSEANYENGVQTGTTAITTISYEGNFVKRIKEENAGRDNFVQNFMYENGKLVTKTEKYERNNYTTMYQYSYAGDQLTNVLKSHPTTIYMNGGGTQSGTYYEESQFTYRGNTIIEVTTRYQKDLNGAVVTNTVSSNGTQTITYTISDGNVVKVVEESEYTTTIKEFTYDTKRNPLYYNYIVNFVNPDPTSFLYADNGKHNALTYKNTYEYNGTKRETLRTYEYTYNADGYATVVKQYKERNGTREFQGTKEYEY